ncbi:MAG: hypothetical protein WDN75_19070 [Bacteroidota bacterium]
MNGTKNLFPGPYAIVTTGPVDLYFRTQIFWPTHDLQIEIDTAATFDSPYLNRENYQRQSSDEDAVVTAERRFTCLLLENKV